MARAATRAGTRTGTHGGQRTFHFAQLGAEALGDLGLAGEQVTGLAEVLGNPIERAFALCGFDEFPFAVEECEVGGSDDEGAAIDEAGVAVTAA